MFFTNSPLPQDVSALATAARGLNRRDIKVVMVNIGLRTDHSNWLPDPTFVINANPRNTDQRRTTYAIGSMVYTGKLYNCFDF